MLPAPDRLEPNRPFDQGLGSCLVRSVLVVHEGHVQLADGLQVGVSVSDERLDDLQHLAGGLGEADEDTVVDLEKTEELEGLALLGVDLVDTLDAGNEDELGLGGNIVAALGLGDASETDLLTLVVAVLLNVGLGALEDLLTLGLGLLFMTVSDGSRDAMLKVCEWIDGISDPKDG